MDPKVSLPGGVILDKVLVKEIELREMTGEEEDILADMRKADDGRNKLMKSTADRMTAVLSRCTVRIGNLKRPDDGRAHAEFFEETWKNAFAGDRGAATIALRRLSLGDQFVFSHKCPSCAFVLPRVVVDLGKLEQRPFFRNLSDADAVERALLQEAHETTTPSGKKVRFKMLRGFDEDAVSQLAEERPEALWSALIFLRTISIDGEPVKWADIKALKSRDRTHLRNHFAQTDGGMDLSIDVTCSKCSTQFKTRMDVGQSSFFFPSET